MSERPFFVPSKPPVRSAAVTSAGSLSTQPCHTSAPRPSTTSSLSTLHTTPPAALPRSRAAMQSRADARWCASGIVGGTAALPRWSARQAVARHARSAEHRSAVTCARPSSPPTVRTAPSTTPSCCQQCAKKQAPRCPFVRCSAMARRSWGHETSRARREHRTRVSVAALATGVAHRSPWSCGPTQSASVCWIV